MDDEDVHSNVELHGLDGLSDEDLHSDVEHPDMVGLNDGDLHGQDGIGLGGLDGLSDEDLHGNAELHNRSEFLFLFICWLTNCLFPWTSIYSV